MLRKSFTSLLICTFLLLTIWTMKYSEGVPKEEFYPYGSDSGDDQMIADDEGATEEIPLPYGPFTFFQIEHKKVYINLNGLISFDTEIRFYSNQELTEFNYSLIAIFYADVDTHVHTQPDIRHGNMFYRVTADASLLERFKNKVVSKFADGKHFDPHSLLIATWDQVGYYDGKHDKANSFQIVLAQGRLHSYVEFLYADDGIQWTVSDSKNPYQRDIPAQMGFLMDDGRNYILNISGKPEVSRINKESNMGIPGNYMFRVSGDFVVLPNDPKTPAMPLIGDFENNEDDYYDGVINPSTGSEDDDEEHFVEEDTNYATTASALAPAPPVMEPESTTAGSNQEQTVESETPDSWALSSTDETLFEHDHEESETSTMTPETLETTTASEIASFAPRLEPPAPPFPACSDSTYQNGCPHDCSEETVPPGCIQCNCPDTDEPTTRAFVQISTTPHFQPNRGFPERSGPFNINPTGYLRTCQDAGTSTCHQNAQCHDFSAGFCCQCSYGFYGNGIGCLANGIAQRINGKVYGKLNGVDLPEMDLHTYAEPSDGRAYTAISQMAPNTGQSFLLLNTLGNVMGWLFAKTGSPGSYNGVELTGTRFNRTATVHVGDSHTVTVRQEFVGRDAFEYLKVKMYITGTLPELPPNSTVDFGEYVEEFNRAGPGVIKSYSASTVTVNTGGQSTSIPLHYLITVDQTIRYDECPYKLFDKPNHTVLKTERSYVFYDGKEKIVRYASANNIDIRTAAQEDPCRSHDCNQPHMICVAQQNTYKCLCLDGFELIFMDRNDRKGKCVDINECSTNIHRCDPNAACHNTEGGYGCTCNSGYRGTGHSCTPIEPVRGTDIYPNRNMCAPRQCHPDANCLWEYSRRFYYCQCGPGFLGDGYASCTAKISGTTTATYEEDVVEGQVCSGHEECHTHGACVYSRTLGHYHCQCRPPYTGDGRNCVSHGETCDKAQNCNRNADCVFRQNELGSAYVCRCKSGFSGDGYSCTTSRTPVQIQCNVLNTCSADAQCVYSALGYVCQCKTGYKGDGYRCEVDPNVPTRYPCRSQQDCHISSHCVSKDNPEEFFCECLPGFKGDGVAVCEVADQCNPGVPNSTCGSNAHCLFDDHERAYVCKCDQGYYGDGRTCQEGQLPTTTTVLQPAPRTCRDDPNLCHQRATCTIDQSATNYVCLCNTGYKGDGYINCEERERSVCSAQNICHRNARCEVSDQGENECQCNPGYQGDGLYCRLIEDCLQNLNMCDRNAECVPDVSSYVCRCKSGFHGSGTRCTADEDLREKSIVFAQGMSLVLRGLRDNDTSKNLVVVPQQIAVGLDFDCKQAKLYWTDVTGHALRSANADGSNVTLVTDEGLESPEGIAVDYTSGNIYYADSQSDTIGVIRSDGKHNYPLIKEGLVNPRALAIDFIDKKLYYSDWNRERPVIGRLNLDGSQRETFIADDIALPNGLVVLHRRRELCWVDAGKQRLECISIHGSGRRIVFVPVAHPFGLTVQDEETLYWTDWEDKKVHSISIFGANHKTYAPSVGSSAKMYGIRALSDECPHGETRCLVNNGDCKYLCLPDSRGGRRCVCPENAVDPECNILNASLI